ncbi:MAG: hypothetical protein AAGD43_09430 [Pseudomonadota bacterium]
MTDAFISLAIDGITRDDFELWAQGALQLLSGEDFEPTGGIHDGGQDGYVRKSKGYPNHYIQISKEADTRGKIRKTIRRLKESRGVQKLTYVTSQSESGRDLLEAKLSHELGVEIVIRDKRWLVIQTTVNENLKSSLYKYSHSLIDDLKKVQSSERALDYSSRLSVVAYLESQVKSLPGTENFQDLCLDTVIYEALSATNPADDKFLTSSQIKDFINDRYPNMIKKSKTPLFDRLAFLSSKDNDPRIRRHPNDNYALPFSVRDEFNEKNLSILEAEDAFVGSLGKRLRDSNVEVDDEMHQLIIATVRHTVVETLRSQAAHFSASFSASRAELDIRVFDIVRDYVKKQSLSPEDAEICFDGASLIFRRVCYTSNDIERRYITYLIKYFSLKFVMEGDTSVSRYFSEMASRLRVYVGSDIIVRCLSEVLVPESSRGMTNALAALSRSGVSLRITRQVISEVYHHICLSNKIFAMDYECWHKQATVDEIKNIDKILIRSFFYAFLEPRSHERQPRGWRNYLANFGNANWFDPEMKSEDEFGSFLLDKFNFDFVELDEIQDRVDEKLVQRLTNSILGYRDIETDGAKILAQNDAEMGLYINHERKARGERVSSDLYGYNTWWLTEETAVLRALEEHDQRSDIVMHPQFLMNLYLIDPQLTRADSRRNDDFAPSLMGLRITDRVSPYEMKKFVQSLGDLSELDEAAVRARIRQASNKLKKSNPFFEEPQTVAG